MSMSFEMWLQSRLTAHGFTPGPIDGIIGPKTTAALKAFEGANGLPVDGRADETVVKALRASSSAISPKDMTLIPNRNKVDDDPIPGSNNVWPRYDDIVDFYGPVGANITRVEVPFDMMLAWDVSQTVRRISIHEKAAESCERVLHNIASIYSHRQINDLGINRFGGSLNVRKMRGGDKYSTHSWAIAIDFNPIQNQLTWKSPRARLSHDDAIPFWLEWEKEGWLSLGRARNFDWMHVQAARL